MPTYEFRCANGHTFERFYRTISTAATEVECPECHVMAQRQISGGAGFAFKGSGFYLTDYGKNAHRKPGPEKKSDGDAGKSSESKPDTKPASSDAAPKAEPPAAKPSKPKSE